MLANTRGLLLLSITYASRTAAASSSRTRWMSKGAFTQPIPFLRELVNKADEERVKEHKGIMARYEELLDLVGQGGGVKGIERHVKKNKKLLIRDRIKHILDPDSYFLEIGKLAGFDMPYGDLPAAGLVAGIGKVHGIYCMISGNDGTVKAGTYYPITVTKSGRVQDIAKINGLPVIYIPDSGGAFLPLQSEIFIQGGRGFYNQATMSSMGIPQIAVVCGSCTAGGAYNPTMSDEAVIVDRIGKIFLGGPPLVKAATGEVVSDEDLGGAFMHSSVSGCTDYFAENETDAFAICRDIVESLNMDAVPETREFRPPEFGIEWEELHGKSHYEKVELYGILARILDGSCWKEFKAFYGPGLITGTGYIEGRMVGIIANTDEILEAEALKASHFIDMCDRRGVPLLFFQNSLPPTQDSEEKEYAVLKARGCMAASVAGASIPTISLTLTACHQDDYILMCGPGFQPNLNFTWPWANYSSFEMTDSKPEGEDAFYAGFNILVDGVIIPEETRSVLAETLRILRQKSHNVHLQGQQHRRPILRL